MRLYFAALKDDKPGQRKFDVKLQGKTVLPGFDVAAKTATAATAHVEEIRDVAVSDRLLIEFVNLSKTSDAAHQPIVSGIEVLRTNAKEITDGVARR